MLVYVLLEHQSKADPYIALRLLSYMIKLWEAQERDWADHHTPRKKRRFSPILPVVLYTGKRPWNSPLTLDAVMELPEALSGFVPRHDTLFLNLLEMPADGLSGSVIAAVLRVIKAEDAPLEEFSSVMSQAVTTIETLSMEHQAEWQRAIQYLLLLISHR